LLFGHPSGPERNDQWRKGVGKKTGKLKTGQTDNDLDYSLTTSSLDTTNKKQETTYFGFIFSQVSHDFWQFVDIHLLLDSHSPFSDQNAQLACWSTQPSSSFMRAAAKSLGHT
jgi:hypothetical protein